MRMDCRPKDTGRLLLLTGTRQLASPICHESIYRFIYRTSLGSRSHGAANCATFSGNRGEPSVESRINSYCAGLWPAYGVARETERTSCNHRIPMMLLLAGRRQTIVCGRPMVGPRPRAAKPSSDLWPKPRHPPTDRLVGNLHAALGKQLLDIAEAEGEQAVQPDGVLQDG